MGGRVRGKVAPPLTPIPDKTNIVTAIQRDFPKGSKGFSKGFKHGWKEGKGIYYKTNNLLQS